MNLGANRFRNTLRDLQDCRNHIADPLSEVMTPGEYRARLKLIELCREIVSEAEKIGILDIPEEGRESPQITCGPSDEAPVGELGLVPAKMVVDGRPWVVAYIDGACSGNPGPGGYGIAVEKSDGTYHHISGASSGPTTNNRMELQAAIELLSRLPQNAETQIYADSQYVITGITEWIVNWKRNGWRNSAKKPVINADLWEKLDELAQGKTIQWQWVRGHNGHPGNERADQLAVAAIRA